MYSTRTVQCVIVYPLIRAALMDTVPYGSFVGFSLFYCFIVRLRFPYKCNKKSYTVRKVRARYDTGYYA